MDDVESVAKGFFLEIEEPAIGNVGQGTIVQYTDQGLVIGGNC